MMADKYAIVEVTVVSHDRFLIHYKEGHPPPEEVLMGLHSSSAFDFESDKSIKVTDAESSDEVLETATRDPDWVKNQVDLTKGGVSSSYVINLTSGDW